MNRGRNITGFTIVELLIVIVVIAILAAINTVAFNGIQQRAKNQQIVSIANSYAKAVRLYQTDVGVFPGAGYAGMQTPCLGAGYPSQQCSNVGSRTESSEFNTVMRPYAASIPSVPTGEVLTNNGNAIWRGAMYEWASPTVQDIRFIQLGTLVCPSISGTVFKSSDQGIGGMVCVVSLN